ncbi:MAG TPA: TonB-dependent receptor [Longimicrobiaceae bacterium]|nr:TonB-dependent receptor [Longimicrobiaceae bacterium]
MITNRCTMLTALAVAMHLSTPATSAAQATGTISGSVVEAASLQPLSGVQISVPGTGHGTLTNSSGEFLIVGIPAGSYTVRAEMLGYGDGELPVTVTAGETSTLRFELSESAIALNEIVVTGQPGATRRREVGTSIASIDVGEKLDAVPITSVGQLLQGRSAGVTSFGSSGTAGGAGTIVLRGMKSLTQDNAPLIYVDGIRLDTDKDGLIGLGGQTTSRLNDLNPNDIARVEIIKGAAATALYGTEASNGVIQIFTKRGQPGESTLNASVKLGANRIPSVFPLMHPDPQYPSANDLLGTGLYQEYSASLRGGAERVSHYVSGTYMNNEGSFVENYFQRANGRVNLSVMPTDELTVDFTSNLTWSEAKLPFNDNYIYGILTTLMLGNPVTKGTETDPYGGAFIPVTYATQIENTDETYNFLGGVTLQHRPSEAFSQKATIGLNHVSGQGISVWPYAPNPTRPAGSRFVAQRDNLQVNFDYAASWNQAVTDAIHSTLSVGGQVFSTSDHRFSASGQAFAAPGLTLVGATTDLINVGESLVKYTTAGVFVQEQVAFSDRLFLIGGVRVDGSSAFGENFGLAIYPKASFSYVMSDEGWFNIPAVSTFRLRGGFGMAGTQPGAFDAVRTYGPFSAVGGQPAIHAVNLGNPDLAPEVSYEWEAGFDAGLMDERLSLAATFYHQTTKDALLNRTFPPSMGFLQPQLTNLGSLRNIGIELATDATLMQNDRITWSVNASYAYNKNEVLDMGETPFIQIDRFGTRVVEGYPAAGKWEFVTVGTDEDGYPIRSDTVVYLGTSMPPHTGSLGTNLTYGPFSLFANAQFAAGHVVNNMNRPYMIRLKTGEEYFNAVIANNDDPTDPQTEPVKQLIAQARIFGDYIEGADWLKMREVTLTYTLPEGVAGMVGSDRARLSVSARNLFTITEYSGTDPEVSSTYTNGSLSIGADYFTVPQPRQLVFGVDVQF